MKKDKAPDALRKKDPRVIRIDKSTSLNRWGKWPQKSGVGKNIL